MALTPPFRTQQRELKGESGNFYTNTTIGENPTKGIESQK